jgi:mannose-6-phosphate isomerase-like protein (cupin superfamily)
MSALSSGNDILEHRPSGARIVLRATTAQTHGRALVLEIVLEPNGWRPPLHVHPRQQQRVEVLAGSAGVQEGRRRSVVGPGTRLAFPPRTPHRIWNAGDEPLQLVVEITPALRFESLLLALCADPARLRRLGLAVSHLTTFRPALLSRVRRPPA